MTARRPLAGLLAALVLVAACSSDGFDAGDQATPTAAAAPSPEPTEPPDTGERVQILSGTVSDLVDRRDLTLTVGDLSSPSDAVVPDVVMLDLADAVTAVEDAGFVPYLAEAFPPSDDIDLVVDSWPAAGEVFLVGANVFLEVDGPTVAVLVATGDQVAGVVNGVQFVAFDRFENWLLRVWLDDPIGFETDDEPITIGREVELRVSPDDATCDAGQLPSDPSALPPGGEITFTLADDTADDLRFAFAIPPRLTATDVTLTC